MRKLYQELKDARLEGSDIRYLSMGMTHDFVVAVEEGANLIRVGTGIFGAREY